MKIPLPAFSPAKDIAHPLFRGTLSRWGWRFFNERTTPAGRAFLFATLLFTHFTLCSLEIQTLVPFSYAFGLWAAALVCARLFRPRVSLDAQHSDRICAGEVLPVEVEVLQAGRFSPGSCRVLPHRLPPGVDAEPPDGEPVPPLKRGTRARVRIGIRCARRGVYALRGYRVETAAPFGLMTAGRAFPEVRTLVVYPRFTRLTRMEIDRGRRFHPGGVALAATMGDATEFWGNREYRDGDSIRDIDWRATARLQRAIVREYRQEYFLRAAVILDTQVGEGASAEVLDAFERAVSVCAAVGDFMAREEYLVDIFAAGPTLYRLTAGRGLAYLDQILEILACVESAPHEPFSRLEPELYENLAAITTVICIFLDWDETRAGFVQALREQGAGVKVILVRDDPPTLDPQGAGERVTVVSGAAFAGRLEEL